MKDATKPPTRRKPTKVDPDDLASASLSEPIKWMNSTKGAKARVLAELQARCTTPVTRQMLERWVHPVPQKRIYPRYGMGLLLLMVLESEKSKPQNDNENA